MLQEVESKLQIKGINEGLLIVAGSLSFKELLEGLALFLPDKVNFISGSRIAIDVGRLQLNRQQLKQLKTVLQRFGLELWLILSRHEETRLAAQGLELGTRLSGSQTDLEGNFLPTEATKTVFAPIQTDKNLILKETVRSGRLIETAGSIVVIGDVNPGAQLVAGGDVVVWGRLRGLVHAGAQGDTGAVICALILTPTQLRIAEHIAIAPEENQTSVIPEQASIKNGQIVAESWQMGRGTA